MEEVLLFMTKIALGKGAIAKKKYYKRVNEKCLRDAQTQKYDFFYSTVTHHKILEKQNGLGITLVHKNYYPWKRPWLQSYWTHFPYREDELVSRCLEQKIMFENSDSLSTRVKNTVEPAPPWCYYLNYWFHW